MWVYFARYWLPSKLTKYNIQEWSFINDNQTPKQIIGPMPDQYQNLLNVFKKHHNKLTTIKNKTTKNISKTLKESQQPIEMKSFQKWNNVFHQKIDWQNVTKFNLKSHAFAPIQNTTFMIQHNALKTFLTIF